MDFTCDKTVFTKLLTYLTQFRADGESLMNPPFMGLWVTYLAGDYGLITADGYTLARAHLPTLESAAPTHTPVRWDNGQQAVVLNVADLQNALATHPDEILRFTFNQSFAKLSEDDLETRGSIIRYEAIPRLVNIPRLLKYLPKKTLKVRLGANSYWRELYGQFIGDDYENACPLLFEFKRTSPAFTITAWDKTELVPLQCGEVVDYPTGGKYRESVVAFDARRLLAMHTSAPDDAPFTMYPEMSPESLSPTHFVHPSCDVVIMPMQYTAPEDD